MQLVFDVNLFVFATILAVVDAAAPSKNQPHLSFRIQDGNYNGLEGLDPTLTWQYSSKSGDIDLNYGIEAAATPTTDLATLPRRVWGKASTDVSGWSLSTCADVDWQDRSLVDLEINAQHNKNDLALHIVATAGDTLSIRRVEATKGLDQQNGDRVTLTPRYDIETGQADVIVTYDNGETGLKLIASPQEQQVTLTRQIDEDNRVAPTINSKGDVAVEWKRRLGDDGSITTAIRPNSSVDIEWNDGGWTANMNMPVDGATISGANVSIKKDVKF